MTIEKESSVPELTKAQWEMMYYAQCRATDALAAKLEAGSDKTLLARIADLEAALKTMNKKHIEAQQRIAELEKAAIERKPIAWRIVTPKGAVIYTDDGSEIDRLNEQGWEVRPLIFGDDR